MSLNIRRYAVSAVVATAMAVAWTFLGLSSAAAASDSALVVVAGPMSGDYEEYGTSMSAGAELAVEDLNAAGGLAGAPLEIKIFDDDDCDVDRATEIAEDIADFAPALVVGHFCSGVSIPASRVYANEGIIQITPSSSNPQLTEGNDTKPTILRSYGRDDRQGIVVANFVNSRWPTSRTFIVHISDAYQDWIFDSAIAAFQANGIEVEWMSYDAGHDSPDDAIETLIEEQAGVVFIIGYTRDLAEFIVEARESGLGAVIIGTDSLMTEEMWDLTDDMVDGVYFAAHPSVELNAFAQPTIDRLKSVGVEHIDYAVYAYVAVQAYAQAVIAAGQRDPGAVAERLHAIELDTIIGPIRFDEYGDLTVDFWGIYEHSDGKIVPVTDTHWIWLD